MCYCFIVRLQFPLEGITKAAQICRMLSKR
jgi:hypothetical protein